MVVEKDRRKLLPSSTTRIRLLVEPASRVGEAGLLVLKEMTNQLRTLDLARSEQIVSTLTAGVLILKPKFSYTIPKRRTLTMLILNPCATWYSFSYCPLLLLIASILLLSFRQFVDYRNARNFRGRHDGAHLVCLPPNRAA